MSRCNLDGWSDVIGEVPRCLSMQTTVHHEAELESDPLWHEVFALCDKDIFPSVHNVLQLLLTVPQTSVTVERLFLLFCETHKTKLRSLMTTDRLASFCQIPFEKDLVRTIDRERNPHTFQLRS